MCNIHSFILCILHNFCYHTECSRSGIPHRYLLMCISYNCLCIMSITCLSLSQNIHHNKNYICLKNQLSMKNKSQLCTFCKYRLLCSIRNHFNILYNNSEEDFLFFKLIGNLKGINQVYNTGHFIKRNHLRIHHKCLNYLHYKSYSLKYYNLKAILHFVRISIIYY